MGSWLMRRRLISQRGFTLVELLIAITVLSLILAISYGFYATLSERWGKQLRGFDDAVMDLRHQNILHITLKGVIPWIVVDAAQSPSFFFVGDAQQLLTVSGRGVFDRQRPEIFRLSVVQNESGLNDLVYQAASTRNQVLSRVDQNIEFDHQMTLFRDLDRISFSYYGWQNLDAKSAGAGQSWYDVYSGIDRMMLPSIFLITLEKQGKRLQLFSSIEGDVERWLAPYLEDLI